MDPNGFGIPARKLRCDGLCNSIILDTFGANCSGSALEINTLEPPLMGGSTKVLTPHTWQRKHPCHIHTIPANWQLRTTSKSLKVVQKQQSTAIWATLTTMVYWKPLWIDCNLSQTSPHGHVWPSTVCNDMSNWSLRKINISTEVKNFCPRYWYP